MDDRLTEREMYLSRGVMDTLKLNEATKEEITKVLNHLLKKNK